MNPNRPFAACRGGKTPQNITRVTWQKVDNRVEFRARAPVQQPTRMAYAGDALFLSIGIDYTTHERLRFSHLDLRIVPRVEKWGKRSVTEL